MRNSLRFILSAIEQKRWFLLGYGALILECITPILAALFQRDLIDRVFLKGHYEVFTKLLALYAVFYFGPKLWFTVRKVIFFHVSYRAQGVLIQRFLEKIGRLSNADLTKESTGKLLNTLRTDISDACDVAVNQMLSEWVYVVVMILLLSLSIASISVSLFLIVLAVACVYYGLLKWFGPKTKAYASAVRHERRGVATTVEEGISGVREIVAFNRQEWQMSRYNQVFQQYFKAVKSENLYKAKILFVSEPFMYGTKLLVILLGAYQLMKGRVSLGAFVVSYTLVDQLVTALGQLFQLSLTGKRLTAPVQQIQRILTMQEESIGTRLFEEPIHSIRFENVTFRYQQELEPILKNLTLEIPTGKKVAIVGKSGSGKSTIAQLLLRMAKPESGEITMNHVTIWSYGEQYTDRVSVVFQQPHFMPLSIVDNLVFHRAYQQEQIDDACRCALCDDFIRKLPDGFETMLGERGTNLSGGQKQRLALSRALLTHADLLILDEATSALDSETEYQVQMNLDKIRRGKTTLIIAHRLSTIQNADLIIVMDQGQIVAQGTHETLLEESTLYQSLFHASYKSV